MSEKQVRVWKCTKPQKEKLLKIMRANAGVACGNYVGVNGAQIKAQVWNTVAEELNALGGPCKTAEQWRKCWANWKVVVKKKQIAYNRFKNLTGNNTASKGPKSCKGLDAELLLHFLPPAVLEGHGITLEAEVPEENMEIGEELFDEYFPEVEMSSTSQAASSLNNVNNSASTSPFYPVLEELKNVQAAQHKAHMEKLETIISLLTEINSNIRN